LDGKKDYLVPLIPTGSFPEQVENPTGLADPGSLGKTTVKCK